MSDSLAPAMTKVVEVLSPLESEQRKRVIQAALALLGEESILTAATKQVARLAEEAAEDAPAGVAAAAAPWLAKSKLTMGQLEQHLHFDGGSVKVISLPGSAAKKIDQVLHTYLMQGLAAFLSTGEASFTDQDARSLCEHFGCYDASNHSKYLKDFGNRITGSKTTGWKLTAPGLSAAAELLKV